MVFKCRVTVTGRVRRSDVRASVASPAAASSNLSQRSLTSTSWMLSLNCKEFL